MIHLLQIAPKLASPANSRLNTVDSRKCSLRGWPEPAGRARNVVRGGYRDELLTFLRVTRGQIPSLSTPRDALEAKRISVVVTTSPRLGHRPVGLDEI
jgi:hypothetical protein